jgi:6-pyruvoyltetrahydropterin/6-carboxytetrahydropterin synthase
MATFELSVTRRFRAVHQLRDLHGGVEPLHEHDWRVTVTVAGPQLDECGLLVDFAVVGRHLDEALAVLAGRNLGLVLSARNPSAERVAEYVASHLAGTLPSSVRLTVVEVEEETGCVVRWLADRP